jgi:hypothetical protein
MGLFLAAMISCLVAYPGCESPVERAQPDPVPTVSQFAVKYSRSGGLKAEFLSLQIEPGRHATLQDRGGTVHFLVAPKKIRRLRAALEDADWETIGSQASGSGTCADCYLYSIGYRGLTVSFDESIQTRRFDHAIEQLEALVDSHRPFH